MSDKVIVYHDPCDDGYGAALAAWRHFKGNALFLPWNYGKDEQFAEEHLPHLEDKEVYILDFSFSTPVMDAIIEKAHKTIWLDHHKTAFEKWLGKMPPEGRFLHSDETLQIVLDNYRSGAMLAWDYFNGGESPPQLYKHLDDRDRWQFKLANTNAVTFYLRSMAMCFPVWDEILQRMQTAPGYDEVVRVGTGIERYFTAQMHQIDANCAVPVKLIYPDGNTLHGWGANAGRLFSSDLGHLLAKRNHTFGLTWYQAENGIYRFSLRSVGDLDVSAIAKHFGGGGHLNAAGFELQPYDTAAAMFVQHHILNL